MVRNNLAERREIARRIKSLRETLGINTQSALAERLEMRQARVNAWENAKEPPTCEALARLGNLAPFPDNLWFWQKCGLDIDGAMLRAAGEILRQRGEEPPRGETLAVRPLQGDGPPWHVDSRIVPNPGAVAYLDSRVSQEVELQGRRTVVVVDTAAQFDTISHHLVLIESRERTAGLPRHGFLMGHFQTAIVSGDAGCVLEFTEFARHYRYESEGAAWPGPFGSLGLADWRDPRGVSEVRRYAVDFRVLLTPEEFGRYSEGRATKDEAAELRRKVEEGRRNFPIPGHIRFIGRVLAIMEVPEGKDS